MPQHLHAILDILNCIRDSKISILIKKGTDSSLLTKDIRNSSLLASYHELFKRSSLSGIFNAFCDHLFMSTGSAV